MKPRREKILTYQQVVVPIPKKTILGDSPMVLDHRSASLGYNSLIFKDLHVVPKEPHPNRNFHVSRCNNYIYFEVLMFGCIIWDRVTAYSPKSLV
jgi:hypothetical protein